MQSFLTKKTPYTLTPNPSDPVYQDEFVNFIVTKLKKAEEGGVKFYNLDNEPALWPSTASADIHSPEATYKELSRRTQEALAVGITRLDPGAQILGPVLFGWSAFENLQSTTDAKEHPPEIPHVHRLLSRPDEASGTRRSRGLCCTSSTSTAYPEAKGAGKHNHRQPGQFPRDCRGQPLQGRAHLWDPTYVEDSWITQWSTNKKPIQLIPRLKEKIAKHYPGTRLAFTEYDYGAGSHLRRPRSGRRAGHPGPGGRVPGLLLGRPQTLQLGRVQTVSQLRWQGCGVRGHGRACQDARPAKCSVYAATDSRKPERSR